MYMCNHRLTALGKEANTHMLHADNTQSTHTHYIHTTHTHISMHTQRQGCWYWTMLHQNTQKWNIMSWYFAAITKFSTSAMQVYVDVLACGRVCISAHVSKLYYVYLFRFIRCRVVGSKASAWVAKSAWWTLTLTPVLKQDIKHCNVH